MNVSLSFSFICLICYCLFYFVWFSHNFQKKITLIHLFIRFVTFVLVKYNNNKNLSFENWFDYLYDLKISTIFKISAKFLYSMVYFIRDFRLVYKNTEKLIHCSNLLHNISVFNQKKSNSLSFARFSWYGVMYTG